MAVSGRAGRCREGFGVERSSCLIFSCFRLVGVWGMLFERFLGCWFVFLLLRFLVLFFLFKSIVFGLDCHLFVFCCFYL